MAKTLKDLVLAMLNATLILVALCLVLALMVVNRANSVTATFAENLKLVAPLEQAVQDTGAEVAALRADLDALRSGSGDLSSAAMTGIETRIDGLNTRLDTMSDSVQTLRSAPERLIDQAISRAGDEAVNTVTRIRGCVPAPDA